VWQATVSLVLDRLFENVTKVAHGLRRAGFVGVFGVDFVCDEEQVFALEINPRFQGSTASLVAFERAMSRQLTSNAHLRALGVIDRSTVSGAPRPDPLCGSELVMWNSSSEFVFHSVNVPRGINLLGLPLPGTVVENGASIGRLRFGGSVLRSNYSISEDVSAIVSRVISEANGHLTTARAQHTDVMQ
jgi:hypothetical protein